MVFTRISSDRWKWDSRCSVWSHRLSEKYSVWSQIIRKLFTYCYVSVTMTTIMSLPVLFFVLEEIPHQSSGHSTCIEINHVILFCRFIFMYSLMSLQLFFRAPLLQHVIVWYDTLFMFVFHCKQFLSHLKHRSFDHMIIIWLR